MSDSSTDRNDYALAVSKDQNDRATEIKLNSCQRPHMRSFYCASAGFFMAFFMWFSISPLLSVIQEDLHLTRSQIWTSTMVSDVSTILSRYIVGPACDAWGARWPMAIVLILTSVPTACTGAIQTFGGLCAVRFGVGLAGSAFVMAQYWMGQMFVKEVIGTANAYVAGWGNLGGGVASAIMGGVLFPYVSWLSSDEMAWRSIFVIPAVVALVTGLIVARVSDDAPKGYYKEMIKNGDMDIRAPSFVKMTDTKNAWLLAIAYACSFGVEITFNNAGSLYFQDEFGLSTQSAALATSAFGLTNLFARAVGGIASDEMNQRLGMQGRLLLSTATIFLQGVATIVFAHCDTLQSAIPTMIVFACLVHATEGAIFGIVPYINPAVSGSIAGIVGLGGNVGGLLFALCFRQFSYQTAFLVMGVAAMASSLVNALVHIPGYSRLWTRKDAVTEAEPGATERARRHHDEELAGEETQMDSSSQTENA